MPPAPSLKLPPYYLGIDPGVTGGVALLQLSQGRLKPVSIEPMFKTPSEFYRWAVCNLIIKAPLTIIFERVHSMKGQGAQAGFTFGREQGMCLTIIDIVRHLRSVQHNYETVYKEPTPQVWMAQFKNGRKVNDFKSRTAWKRYLRSQAIELFPDWDIWIHDWWNEGRKDAVSDAILMAYYGWTINHI